MLLIASWITVLRDPFFGDSSTSAGEDLEASLGRMTERCGDSLDWVADSAG
jgi:hypothetical protein